jgi:predicted dienelactone hydrolase
MIKCRIKSSAIKSLTIKSLTEQPMLHRTWRIVALSACLLQSAYPSSVPLSAEMGGSSASEFKVGGTFRKFTPPDKSYNWRGAKTHALLATVWYPAAPSAVEHPIDIPGMSQLFVLGKAAQDADLALAPAPAPAPAKFPARFPMIVISHGTGGSALVMAWLGTALAAQGYIAVAVNHPGNNGADGYTALGFSTWWERARDLSVVIDSMLADPIFGSHIDPNRIGAAGFSLGGYTMIEIAGGITDPAAYKEFCASPRADNICKSPPEFPTLLEDFDKLSKTDPEFQAALRHAGDSYRDPRVRAVFAMAPALGPAFHPASLEKIAVPVMIVAGQADTNVPIASSAKYFAANIPGAKLTIFPGNVAHYVFLDSCTEDGRKTRPLLCTDGAGVDRDAIHAKTAALAVEFFRATMK